MLAPTAAPSGGDLDCAAAMADLDTLPVRERVARLVDEGSFTEEGMLAGARGAGAVTGTGTIDGRPVAVMADDAEVEGGSWGAATVEKVVRIQEHARRQRIPVVYLVDSTGARMPEQAAMFAGRRHAGRVLFNQVALSGVVPQVCALLGPSRDGSAYVPALCDAVVARVDAEAAGMAQLQARDDEGAIALVRRYLSFLPSHWEWLPPVAKPAAPASAVPLSRVLPPDERETFDMHQVLDSLLDGGSWLELHPRWAPALLAGFGRINGRPIGVVASQPRESGGALTIDAADKAARFVWSCNAFGVALLFLADTPGFAGADGAGREDVVRHAARMISAVSEATVPRVSVIVRRAYGDGLYAMGGPASDPDACLALRGARVAALDPGSLEDAALQGRLSAQSDVLALAGELVIDAIVEPDDLRAELIRRFAVYAGKRRDWPDKRNPVTPV